MANYESRMRTSYFQVKDKQAFLNELEKVENLGHIEIDSTENTNDITLTGDDFSHGTIPILNENGDYVGDEPVSVFEIIRSHLIEGQSVLVNGIGYEKMRFIQGTSFIITNQGVIGISSENAIKQEAIRRGLLTEEQAYSLDCTF